MELYLLYNFVLTILLNFAKKLSIFQVQIWSLVGATAIWLVFFILQGIGLSRMAKNRQIGKRWLAFVPFANIWYIGKLVGVCDVFGQKMKRTGLYTMLAQIAITVFCAFIVVAEIYLYKVGGLPKLDQWNVPYWGLSGFAGNVESFYSNSDYILLIFELIYQILLLILVLGLYKRYYPKNFTFLGFLALLVPLSRFIVIFALRNRKAIDYEAYIRARREAYMRQQQQYRNAYGNPYQNPYGNPYGRPYNTSGQQSYGGQTAPNVDEPFSEFSSDKKGESPFDDFNAPKNENQNESGNQKDEFFN